MDGTAADVVLLMVDVMRHAYRVQLLLTFQSYALLLRIIEKLKVEVAHKSPGKNE